MAEHLGIQNIFQDIGSGGIGFIVVPNEADREQYIEDCYRTNTVTINGGLGYGYFSGVAVDIDVMQQLRFPTNVDNDTRGTAVVWVKDSISQRPVIVAVLRNQDQYFPLGQYQRYYKCEFEGKSVEVFFDANTSDLSINIVGDNQEAANLNIKVTSVNKDSSINLECDNEVNLYPESALNVITSGKVAVNITKDGETKTEIQYEAEKGFHYKDEFENEITAKDGEVDIISNKINHNEGKEPMVLGDTLASLLKDLVNGIKQLTVVTPAGTSSVPVNIATFEAIGEQIDNIKSSKSNLD